MTMLLAPPAAPPRFHHCPVYVSSAGQDCIDLAEAAGLILDPWQRAFILDALAEGPTGLWAAMQVALIVPRQNGKGGILEALELFCLFMLRDCRLITHTAHRFDTCLDHFRRIRPLIEETPDLLAMVKDNGRGINGMPSGIKDSNGKESIELTDGSRLNFKAREKGSGRGFTGDLIVFDEAFYLGTLTGLVSALSARRNPQIWFTSSAPVDESVSDSLRQIMRDGRSLARGELVRGPGEPGEVYAEWSAEADLSDPADLARLFDDPEALRAANPATEVGRVNEMFTKVERRLYTDREYARERFGVVVILEDDDAPKWEIVTNHDWSRNESDADPDVAGWLTGAPALSVAMTVERDAVAIVAVGDCVDGCVGVEVLAHAPGVDWVVAAVAGIVADDSKPTGAVVIDPKSPAGTLIAPLRAAGVDVIEPKYADLIKATGEVYDLVVEGAFHHRGRPELTTAVSRGSRRAAGDAWLIDRRTGVDVTTLDGAVQALHGHRNPPPTGPPPTLIF